MKNFNVFEGITIGLLSFAIGLSTVNAADDPEFAQSEARLNDARESIRTADTASLGNLYFELYGALEGHLLNGYVPIAQEAAIKEEMLNALLNASQYSDSNYRYSRKITDLTLDLNDEQLFMSFMNNEFTYENSLQKSYLLLLDYADGLHHFGYPSEAEEHFRKALALRATIDSYEAVYRFVYFLVDQKRDTEALDILSDLPTAMIEAYPSLVLIKQEIIYQIGADSSAVDNEVEEIREKQKGSEGFVTLYKTPLALKNDITNPLGLNEVQAFSHNDAYDDSRGILANDWMYLGPIYQYVARWGYNIAETIYNEAVGEGLEARRAVSWAIRNRAWINMNGADNYLGSESDNNVWSVCRNPTPQGPQAGEHGKRYSCVVHGRTTSVGASHSQMNDAHVDYGVLMASGILDITKSVVNGWTADPTSSPTYYPYGITTTGNPNGAQEWLGGNYCAANPSQKRRAGNVGGNLSDPGDYCPTTSPQLQPGTLGDNWFWARKP